MRQLERRWRRATRRSDEPLAHPELPEADLRSVEGAQVELRGATLHGPLLGQTGEDGWLVLSVPPGSYELELTHARSVPLTVVDILIVPGRATTLRLHLEQGEVEDIVVTQHPGAHDGSGPHPQARPG